MSYKKPSRWYFIILPRKAHHLPHDDILEKCETDFIKGGFSFGKAFSYFFWRLTSKAYCSIRLSIIFPGNCYISTLSTVDNFLLKRQKATNFPRFWTNMCPDNSARRASHFPSRAVSLRRRIGWWPRPHQKKTFLPFSKRGKNENWPTS